MGIISRQSHPFRGYSERLGNNVKILRMQRKLTQEELAAICHMNQPYLAQIESGTTNVTLKFMVKISRGLKIKVKDLFDF